MIASAQCIMGNTGSLKRDEDGFHSRCRNVHHQHTQDSWVQTIFLMLLVIILDMLRIMQIA